MIPTSNSRLDNQVGRGDQVKRPELFGAVNRLVAVNLAFPSKLRYTSCV